MTIKLPDVTTETVFIQRLRGIERTEFFRLVMSNTSSWTRGSVRVAELSHGGLRGTIGFQSLRNRAQVMVVKVERRNLDEPFILNAPYLGMQVATLKDVETLKSFYNETISKAQRRLEDLAHVETLMKAG